MHRKIKVGTHLTGTDGTVVEVLDRVTKRGFTKVKVVKQGELLIAKVGSEITYFNLLHGLIKFDLSELY